MKITVATGFGYLKQGGEVLHKCEYSIGEQEITDGFEYVEVADKSELDAIEVYQDPQEIEATQNEAKVALEIRRLAVESLKSAGKLPQEFE